MTQERVCSVCGKASYEGLNIGDGYICDRCEARMVGAEVSDSDYRVMMYGLRRISLPCDDISGEKADRLETELNVPELISVDELLERSGMVAMQKGNHKGEFAIERLKKHL